MTVAHTQLPDHNVIFHHDDAAQPDPKMVIWFLHGLPTTMHRKTGETAQTFMERVLLAINEERDRVARCKNLLDPQAPADVYVGELEPACLAALKMRHMRQFILAGLHREAGAPASTRGTGTSRLRAMNQLAQMTGIPIRHRKVIKSETLPA